MATIGRCLACQSTVDEWECRHCKQQPPREQARAEDGLSRSSGAKSSGGTSPREYGGSSHHRPDCPHCGMRMSADASVDGYECRHCKLGAALNASEKECARLMGVVGQLTRDKQDQLVVPCIKHDCADSQKLRLELENLRVGSKSETADLRMSLEDHRKRRAENEAEIVYLIRELERERAKNRKRGV